jgi:hypothetical protein
MHIEYAREMEEMLKRWQMNSPSQWDGNWMQPTSMCGKRQQLAARPLL